MEKGAVSVAAPFRFGLVAVAVSYMVFLELYVIIALIMPSMTA